MSLLLLAALGCTGSVPSPEEDFVCPPGEVWFMDAQGDRTNRSADFGGTIDLDEAGGWLLCEGEWELTAWLLCEGEWEVQ